MLLHKYILATVWAVLVLLLTLTPGQFLPKVDYWSIHSIDKYIHFFIFCVQVILLFLGGKNHLRTISPKYSFLYLMMGVLFGMAIEFIQTIIPHRSFELNDLIANTIGCLIGAAGSLLIFNLKRQNSRMNGY